MPARARRRSFTAEYRLAILREADACKQPGEIGALLRREGLYSSHLSEWRNSKPELLASEPNRVWSWHITKLRGPVKGTCFHLYVILDIYSRLVVGWMVAPAESARLAKRLIKETIRKHGADPSTGTPASVT